MTDPAEPTLETVAYHEAGHAVIGALNRFTPRHVTVIPSRFGRGYAGRRFRDLDLATAAGKRTFASMLAMLLGGPLASVQHDGDALGSDPDIALLAELVDEATKDPATAAAIVDEMVEQVADQVEENWPAIEAVAEYLLEHGRMTGAEVRRVAGLA